MYLKKVVLRHDRFPTGDCYPFNLAILNRTEAVMLSSPITFFIGENGTGKSTLLKAVCRRCGIHIWEGVEWIRYDRNPYEESLSGALEVEWADGPVPGSFFGSQIFRNFAQILDEWATSTPEIFGYFGGKSLMTQSHGESLMSYFAARYQRKGIYFMDEPETALSPKSQIELARLMKAMADAGHAQFVAATHSPILMACPGGQLLSFDRAPIREIAYEETEHYRVYRDFMADRAAYLKGI